MGTDTRLTYRTIGNRGSIVVLIALSIAVLIAMAGLVIDLGYMYSVKSKLQNAADAGALAGAQRLNGTAFTNQTGARSEAVKFATFNFSLVLNPNQDVVVGFWDSAFRHFTSVVPVNKVANAVKVNVHRTDAPTGANPELNLILGRIVGRPTMGAAASAIAWRPPLAGSPMAICIEACSLSYVTPLRFYFKQDSPNVPVTVPAGMQTLGWTEFSDSSKATDLGPNSLISKYIRGDERALNVCGKNVFVNNGLGEAIKELQDTYNKKRVGNIWETVLPVFDKSVGSSLTTACPPGNQPTEPYKLVSYALVTITDVKRNPDPYVEISAMDCHACNDERVLGQFPQLCK